MDLSREKPGCNVCLRNLLAGDEKGSGELARSDCVVSTLPLSRIEPRWAYSGIVYATARLNISRAQLLHEVATRG